MQASRSKEISSPIFDHSGNCRRPGSNWEPTRGCGHKSTIGRGEADSWRDSEFRRSLDRSREENYSLKPNVMSQNLFQCKSPDSDSVLSYSEALLDKECPR
jgi:hypothetical protein